MRIQQKLFQKFPKITFNIVINSSDVSEESLTSQNIDILVGQKWNNPLFSIATLKIQEMALLIPDTCPLFLQGKFYRPFSENNLTFLNDSSYVAVSSNSYLQQKINTFLGQNNIIIHKMGAISNPYLAAKVAVQCHATTIITTEIAKQSLRGNDQYNLMVFPKEVLNLELAITYLRDASQDVKTVGEYLYQFIRDL